MSDDAAAVRSAIAALEAQRSVLGDVVVELALAPLRARLAGWSGPAGPSLRQVTILFMDVAGSTALSQQLDPESVSAVMDGALARGTALVRAHRGKVLQYAGDNLLAVFGADGAREDDAENAVRCGLALLRLGRELGAEVEAAHGYAGLAVRVGVHSGSVLLGAGIDEEGSIRGSAVNVAARMEQSAPIGALRISQATWRLAGAAFEAEAQPPIEVKGLAEPVRTWLVHGENRQQPRPFRAPDRGVEGLATPLVGREAELSALAQAWAVVAMQGRARAVVLVGAAGAGKSRLLAEFEDRLGPSVRTLRARAVPSTQGQPYGLLRDLVARELALPDGAAMAQARQLFLQGMRLRLAPRVDEATAAIHGELLGHLIGLDFADGAQVRGIGDDLRQLRTRGFTAALEFVRACADGEPALLLLEDLHWADDDSLDFLERLATDAAAPDRPLALLSIALTRPELFERRPARPDAAVSAVRIEIGELDAAASAALADRLLEPLFEVPPGLREALIERSAGNPYFMEELLKSLIDRGAIDAQEARWRADPTRIAAALAPSALPSTLQGLLLARLDALPAAERAALQQASAIGYVFWDAALEALDAASRGLLPRLEQRRLALPVAGAPPDTVADAAAPALHEHVFAHKLLHDVTEQTLLRAQRQALHGAVAGWLEGLEIARSAELLPTVAEHWRLAGEPLRCARALAGAAEHAVARFAHAAALAHVAQALPLVEARPLAESGALRWQLLVVRTRSLDMQGERAGQAAAIDAMQALAAELGDPARAAEAAWRRADMRTRTGPFDEAERLAEGAVAAADAHGDAALRLRARTVLAQAVLRQGQGARAQQIAERALAAARELGDLVLTAQLLTMLAPIADVRGRPQDFLDLARQSAELHRSAGNLRGECAGLLNVGVAWAGLGALEPARDSVERSLGLARTVADQHLVAAALTNLLRLAVWAGRHAEARALGAQALAAAQAAGAPQFAAMAHWCLGRTALAVGDVAESEAQFERTRSLSAELNAPTVRDGEAGLAEVALVRGDAALAERWMRGLVAKIDAGRARGPSRSEPYVEWVCWRVLHTLGDARADAWLQAAWEGLRRVLDTLDHEEDAGLRRGFIDNVPEHRAIAAAWTEASRR
jgi:class 3 adenylate cyclase